ncbi:MAG: hypothetical protein N3E40_01665, partial [Dehalococcoidia bacterium]|nr:hypothetical protein [Dehalococcoidia bacterium]
MEDNSERNGQAVTPSRGQIRSSIRYSTGEGVASAASEGATEEYYIPYALAAGASVSVVGWLIALAQLALAFCYFKVPDYVRKIGSRKRSILVLVLVDVITFLPFVFIPFVIRDYIVQAVFLFYILSLVPTIVIGPIWASWITELVPVGVRGRYLGQRLTFMGVSELACFIAAGLVLNWFAGQVFVGFSIIFTFAAMARLVAWFMYWKMKDVPITRREEVSHFGIHDVLPVLKNGSIGRFMVFAASLYFTVFLAQPFFAVFMLSDLNFSYLAFMVVICSEQAARLIVLRYWGKYADARGNLKVIQMVSVIIPLVPLLWLVSQNILYLVFVQVITGVAMAGFDLCAANFMYGAAPAGSRIKYIALFRALNSAGAAFGALLGGLLALVLVPVFGHKLLTLFLLSGLLRGAVVFKLLPSIVDVSLKRTTSLPRGYYRPGDLSADAVSEGFGWGLLYVPESMRRDIRRAFDRPPKTSPGERLWHSGERLFQRWLRLALRNRTVRKPQTSAVVEEHERLRCAALDRLVTKEATRAVNGKTKAIDGRGGLRARELWTILGKRFEVKAAASADRRSPVGVALFHSPELGQRVMRALLAKGQAGDGTLRRSGSDGLRQKWLREAIQQRIRLSQGSPTEVGTDRNSTGAVRRFVYYWRHLPGGRGGQNTRDEIA